jgi:hypothetical protein
MRWIVDHRSAEIGTDIEEVVLDPDQESADIVRDLSTRKDDTDRRVRFIDSGICLKTWVVLGSP